jgi:hypothetical protein
MPAHGREGGDGQPSQPCEGGTRSEPRWSALPDRAELPIALLGADAYDDRGPLGSFSHFFGEKDLTHAVAAKCR